MGLIDQQRQSKQSGRNRIGGETARELILLSVRPSSRVMARTHELQIFKHLCFVQVPIGPIRAQPRNILETFSFSKRFQYH